MFGLLRNKLISRMTYVMIKLDDDETKRHKKITHVVAVGTP